MSYVRFSANSDVYIYASIMGGVECCGCRSSMQSVNLRTRTELVAHLEYHERAGHRCGHTSWAGLTARIFLDDVLHADEVPEEPCEIPL